MYREVIDKQIANAMKNGDHLKLSIWRLLKNEFIKFRTSGKNQELTDEKELAIIKKMVQQRKESIIQYNNAGREALATAEEQEMVILQSLLPNEPTVDEIDEVISSYLSKKTEKVTMKDMKDVMNVVKTKYPTADGGLISKLFREKYI